MQDPINIRLWTNGRLNLDMTTTLEVVMRLENSFRRTLDSARRAGAGCAIVATGPAGIPHILGRV